ncbi:ATP-binding protein [Galbitalea sp. SE-J8]|uniref:sensor histidine kinase n=1 Tax=Galbitalea sp. SE-J8 TaxID=3054952 RepID=UPI00259C9273|nr:PAS domain-containing sensor histidine kinase [Galbitalea sp. SE-J8]MDM4763853.1 ATP-binding protein [Galbitalea sp. SE-J8]
MTRRAVLGDALRTLGTRSTPAGRRTMVTRSQLPFAVLLTVALGTILLTDAAAASVLVAIPWAVVAVVTGVLYLVPWEARAEYTGLATSLVDIAALVVVLVDLDGRVPEVALLQLIPIVVMAYCFGIAGLAASILSTFAVALVPASIRADAALAPLEVVGLLVSAVAISLVAVGVYGAAILLTRAQKRLSDAVVAADDQNTVILTVLEAIDAGTAFVRSDRSLAFTNSAFRELVERSRVDPETLAGTRVFGADRTTPLGPEDQMIAQALRGEYFDSRLHWVGEPGAQHSVLVSARPVVRADGVLLGSAFVSKDVTELTDAIRAREDFLAGVSHELRTPLTSIIGYLEVIQDSVDAGTLGVQRELDIVQRNATQLMMRIGDLLHVADETVTMRARPAEVTRIAEQAVGAIRIRAESAGLELTCALCPSFEATIDQNRFAQVIDNLLTNAVKYTPRGGHVRLVLDNDDERMTLSVADDGIGIAEDEQPRVFERFYRTESVRGGAIGGAGLGLSIVRRIVQGHGGEVGVVSAPGAGSTFTVVLPLSPPPGSPALP